jgi:hypothetical protein
MNPSIKSAAAAALVGTIFAFNGNPALASKDLA